MTIERKAHALPGWCWSTVREALRNHDHVRVPIKAEDRAARSGEYPYYGASGAIDTIDDYLFDGSYLLVGEDGANLLSRSKPIAFQAHGRFWVNNHAHVLSAYDGMPIGYFEGYFNLIDLAPHVTGTAQPKLPQAAMNKIAVPIAPCDEQKRIVEAIESYFTRLDDAVATLERVERNLKRYRASVLQSAVEGRLVPTEAALAKQEGRDYEPASVLLERILTERRRRWSESGTKGKYQPPTPPDTINLPELPEGWCWATVDQVASDVRYGSSSKTSEDLEDGIPVLRMGNIVDGYLDYAQLKFLPSRHPEFPELLLEVGDILFNRTNSPELVGKSAVFTRGGSASFASYLIRVRASTGVQPRYLSHFINSPAGRQWIRRVVTQQVGQANVNGTKLRACAVPVPPSAEQNRIVEEIERTFSLVFATAGQLRRDLVQCGRLRQSVLKWAFEGKLADQDPEDEPASVLLERIKVGRDWPNVESAPISKRGIVKKRIRV